MSCCTMMKKAAIPSLVITNLIVFKTKDVHLKTAKMIAIDDAPYIQ